MSKYLALIGDDIDKRGPTVINLYAMSLAVAIKVNFQIDKLLKIL